MTGRAPRKAITASFSRQAAGARADERLAIPARTVAAVRTIRPRRKPKLATTDGKKV